MLEIAEHLVGSDPQMSVLVITGSPMIHAFRIPQGVDYIKLPCVGRDETGVAGVKTLGLDYAATLRMRANMILMAARDFAPDLVIVDKKPLGIDDELEPMVAMLRQGERRPAMVLLLRDILDAPQRTVQQWRKGRYHDAIAAYYDRVLVVGEPEVFDVAHEYDFPPATSRRLAYCGYIARHSPLQARELVRAGFGLDAHQPLVLVTAGGGADGQVLMRTYLQGLLDLPREPAWTTLLVAGPELAAGERRALAELATTCPRVVCIDFTREMLSCMNAADLVVAMGGYNTVCELLTLRKPCIIVPRVEPVQEQWIRAHRMQQMGLLTALHPDVLTPQALMQAIAASLADGACGRARPALEMTGLSHLQRQVTELLAARDASPARDVTIGNTMRHDGLAACAVQLDAALHALACSLGRHTSGSHTPVLLT
jgi:predicted glycosyltransferase